MPSNFLLYQKPDGETRLEVRLEEETVWLSLTDMSNLFQRDKSVISRHISNIFKEGESVRGSVIAKFATTNDTEQNPTIAKSATVATKTPYPGL